MQLDPRSITVMTALMAAVLGLVLLGVRRNYPSTIHGLLPWAMAPMTCAFAAGVYALQGLWPEFVVAQTGNALLLTGCGLFYFGSQRFFGRPVSWRLWGAIALLSLAVLTWFLIRPDYRVRMVVFTGTMTACVLAHARLVLRDGRGFAARLIAGTLLLQAAVLVGRGLASFWVDGAQSSRFAMTTVQTAYIASYCFSVLLLSVGVLLMASERVREEFELLATRDALTGALTRRAVLQAGGEEFDRWRRYGQPLSLVLLDIDHFKQVNDRHGHQAGDRVLSGAVAAMRGELRVNDRLGRYGGEEFVILLPSTDAEAARASAERVRAALAAHAPEPGIPPCSASLGVAWAQPGDTSLDALLARADAALYRAKANGRNRVE
ncbi:GGDEF domain-containing protein [Mitsuaria sp. BK037]|uniref:GGDEF domain-containing protein n=1 Tax=Mitsuaria sp. BK037 TaxID=2587122 RepID=UPI00161215AF|nr:GGDEF domain-containing protein [Mitsuaria sp. BK037]MBB3284194.1 diguanylate cyclase (GGDEF)-like protein [Mitsuaria sp. BK037]